MLIGEGYRLIASGITDSECALMWITPAFAQAATGTGGTASEFAALLPMVLIFVVFYFLLIRPQQKRMKQHKEMLAAVRRGDRVVTGGGIIGSVTKIIDDNELQVEICEGVRVRVQRGLISAVLSKTEPAQTGTTAPKSETEAPASGNESGTGGTTSRLGRLLGGKKE